MSAELMLASAIFIAIGVILAVVLCLPNLLVLKIKTLFLKTMSMKVELQILLEQQTIDSL